MTVKKTLSEASLPQEEASSKKDGGQYDGPSQRERLWSKNFVLVVLAILATSLAFQFLMPTLPLYLKSLGGRDAEVGMILGIYSLSALASRILTGRALDVWGRKWPLVIGAFLYFVAMPLYFLTTIVPSILLLRLFHGLGFGMVTTACSAMAADLAPPHRRGEALGYYGNAQSLAMAFGSGIALWLIEVPGLPLSGFSLLFLACSAIAGLELVFSLFTKETRQPIEGHFGLSGSSGIASFFSRAAVPMTITMFFCAFSVGAVMSFVPIYFSTQTPENTPVFFFVYAIIMVVTRPFVGIITDRINRRLVAIPLMVLTAVGVCILALPPNLPVVISAALVFGFGFGSLNPTLLALVVDTVEPRKRGAALATYMASLDIGIGAGSIILGLVAEAAGYRAVFPIGGGAVLIGLAYFLVSQRSRLARRPVLQPSPEAPLPTA